MNTITGREYLRVSLDRSGRARSIDEQHAENEAAAHRRGMTLGRAYEDVSISASRYTTKVRDGFALLLADLEAGRFGADELWLWEASRGSRKVSEWVALIEACERSGVALHVTTHGRTYDPANGRDRRSLLEDAVDSEYESSKISTRALRAAAANAAAGKPHGQAPYGYLRRYDERTRQMIAQEPDPVTAPVVRELFARLHKGESLRSIEMDYRDRDIVNGRGGPFSSQHLRALALNAAYAGLRLSDPAGRRKGVRNPRPGPGVSTVEGTWEALVPKATYYAVHALLTDPKRVTTRPGRAKHLLSGIAMCAECDGPLFVTFRDHAPSYQCRKGCVRVRKDDLEEHATAEMLGYLGRHDVHEHLSAAKGSGEPLAALRDELATERARLAELADAAASGALSLALVARAEPQVLSKIADLEARERAMSTPTALHGFMTPGVDVRRRWEAAAMSTRREVARLLLSPDLLGLLAVSRRPVGRRNIAVPVAERTAFRVVAPAGHK